MHDKSSERPIRHRLSREIKVARQRRRFGVTPEWSVTYKLTRLVGVLAASFHQGHSVHTRPEAALEVNRG